MNQFSPWIMKNYNFLSYKDWVFLGTITWKPVKKLNQTFHINFESRNNITWWLSSRNFENLNFYVLFRKVVIWGVVQQVDRFESLWMSFVHGSTHISVPKFIKVSLKLQPVGWTSKCMGKHHTDRRTDKFRFLKMIRNRSVL